MAGLLNVESQIVAEDVAKAVVVKILDLALIGLGCAVVVLSLRDLKGIR